MTARVRRHVDKQTKADVLCKKPFKAAYRELYNQWMASGKQSLTPAGNMRPPDKLICLNLVVKAWEAVSTEVIVSSFKACGIRIAVR